MNAVTQYANQAATMSSREIAELTGKQHQHVKRDIENMLIELNEDVSKFGHIYLDAMNRKQTEYHLDRDMTDCLLTGYSAKARMAVIKRWRDLENQQPTLPNFNDPVEAARQWADAKESERNYMLKFEAANVELEQARPAKEFVEKYVNANGNVTFTALAKILDVKQPVLRAWLIENNIQYKQGNDYLPYANHINCGRVVMKIGMRNDHTYTWCMFTPKGAEYVLARWNKERMVNQLV